MRPLPRAAVAALATLVLLGGLAGCASLAAGKRNDQLDVVLKSYRQYIRWGYFNEAAGYIRRRDPAATQTISPDDLADFRVTSYETQQLRRLDEAGKEMEVTSSVDAYSTASGVVRSLMDRQTWYFDDEAKRWYLDGELPDLAGRR